MTYSDFLGYGFELWHVLIPQSIVSTLIIISMNTTSRVALPPAHARFHVACMAQPHNLHVTMPSESLYNSAFITN